MVKPFFFIPQLASDPSDPGWIAVIYIISWTAYAIHFLWALRQRRVASGLGVDTLTQGEVMEFDRHEWVDHFFLDSLS